MIEAYQFRKAAQATFDKMVDRVNALALKDNIDQSILKEFLAQRKEAADNLKSAQEKVDALEKQLHPLEKPPSLPLVRIGKTEAEIESLLSRILKYLLIALKN